jgi:hypothetical protein
VEISRSITKLVDLAAGDGDVEEIRPKIARLKADRQKVQQRLAAMPMAPDRAELKAALEQRSTDWKQKLRGYPEEARFVVQQLLGPLELWHGRVQDVCATDEDLATLLDLRGRDLPGQRFEDLGFTAVIRPEGLLSGLGAFSMVAGAGFEPATFGL